jgi:HK97 family phage prohead protease
VKIEVRGKQVKITGYITTARDSKVINHPTEGKFIEQIAPKAFEKALGRVDDLPLVFNHDKNQKLASIKQGSLQLWEDSVGLRCMATITQQDVVQQVVNKKISGWSFAFQPINQRFEEIRIRTDGIRRRIVEDMELTEVSILSKPANPAYSAQTLEFRTMPLDLDLYFKQVDDEIKKLRGGIR